MNRKWGMRSEDTQMVQVGSSPDMFATKFYNQVPYAMPKAVETTLDFVATGEPKARGADPKVFVDESIVSRSRRQRFYQNSLRELN